MRKLWKGKLTSHPKPEMKCNPKGLPMASSELLDISYRKVHSQGSHSPFRKHSQRVTRHKQSLTNPMATSASRQAKTPAFPCFCLSSVSLQQHLFAVAGVWQLAPLTQVTHQTGQVFQVTELHLSWFARLSKTITSNKLVQLSIQ